MTRRKIDGHGYVLLRFHGTEPFYVHRYCKRCAIHFMRKRAHINGVGPDPGPMPRPPQMLPVLVHP